MKISLYSDYPRVVGYPIRLKVVHSLEHLNEHIEKFISKTDIHISIYSFFTLTRDGGILKPDYESAKIDKVFLDLDEGSWINNMKDLHNWCMDEDILHRMHLSSYVGGHFFIGCNPRIQFKKTTLYNFQGYLSKKFNIILEKGISTMGDIARSFRVSNTYNFKRYCYCIPLKEEELQKIKNENDPYLKELTLHPRKEEESKFWYGNKLVNLSSFDKETYLYKIKRRTTLNIDKLLSNKELNEMKIIYDKFPPCIRSWMSMDWLGYKIRYLLILYLREQNIIELNDTEIVSILKSVVSEEEWRHCSSNEYLPGHNPGENLIPIKKTLSNLNYKMPSCFQLDSMGLCPYKCGRWSPIYV